MRATIRKRRKGFTLIELMIVVTIISILASIAIPNFMQIRAQARQAEAKALLKNWFTAQRSYHGEKAAFTEVVSQVGFSPERGNRYQYMFSATCNYEVRAAVTAATDATKTCITVDQFKYNTSSLTPTPSVPTRTYTAVGANPGSLAGLGGTCPNCNIQAVAAGNLDNELAGIDTWVIGTKDAQFTAAGCGTGATAIPAGVPSHAFNDATCN